MSPLMVTQTETEFPSCATIKSQLTQFSSLCYSTLGTIDVCFLCTSLQPQVSFQVAASPERDESRRLMTRRPQRRHTWVLLDMSVWLSPSDKTLTWRVLNHQIFTFLFGFTGIFSCRITPEVWIYRQNRLAFCRHGNSNTEADISSWLRVILKLTRNLSCDLSGPWAHIHATALSFQNGPDLSFCFQQKNACSTILDNQKQEKKKLLKHNFRSFSHLCAKHDPNCKSGQQSRASKA